LDPETSTDAVLVLEVVVVVIRFSVVLERTTKVAYKTTYGFQSKRLNPHSE